MWTTFDVLNTEFCPIEYFSWKVRFSFKYNSSLYESAFVNLLTSLKLMKSGACSVVTWSSVYHGILGLKYGKVFNHVATEQLMIWWTAKMICWQLVPLSVPSRNERMSELRFTSFLQLVAALGFCSWTRSSYFEDKILVGFPEAARVAIVEETSWDQKPWKYR